MRCRRRSLRRSRARTPDAQPALTALALAGTRSRFARPAPAQAAEAIPEAARALHADPRPVLPAKARRHLQRLLAKTAPEPSRIVLGEVWKRLAPLGVRLHPFDFPGLSKAFELCHVLPGMAERAFLALTQADAPAELQAQQPFHEAINAGNWRDFGRVARLCFLTELRSKDAAAGLAMLEACFTQEPASLRADLVQALRVGLSAEDRAFLEGLANDRAEGVRTAADKLLWLLPGTDRYCIRRDMALASFKVTAAKLPNGERRVAFTGPDSKNLRYIEIETFSRLENIPAEELAAGLGVTLAGFLESVSDLEDALICALLRNAIASHGTDVVAALIPRMSGDAFDMLMDHWRDSSILPRTSTALPRTMRQALLDRFVARLQSDAFPHSGPLEGLRNCLGEPLPVEVAERLLASTAWRDYLAALAEKQTVQQKTDHRIPDAHRHAAARRLHASLPRRHRAAAARDQPQGA